MRDVPYGKPLPVKVAPGTTKHRAILLFPADLPKAATVAYKVSDSGETGPAEAGASPGLGNAVARVQIAFRPSWVD